MSILKEPQGKIDALSKDQKSAVLLLSVGSFLEAFDFSLYFHMSIILNVLFFPPTDDPTLKAFTTSFGLASSFFLVPFGSVFLGYMGDRFGRRNVIMLTTMSMALCCLTLAALPPYAHIGISAAIIVTICRMLQSVSVIAESSGAEIYISETIRPPKQYPMVAYIEVFGAVGNIAALAVGTIFTNVQLFSEGIMQNSWRGAFLFGAVVACIGTAARRSLKEATNFANRQKLIKQEFKRNDLNWNPDIGGINSQKPLGTYLAYFCMNCAKPVSMYFVYFYCGDLLAERFHFTTAQVIGNNLLVAIADFFGLMVLARLSYKIAPLKLLRFKALLFLSIVVFLPTAMKHYNSPTVVLFFQCFGAILAFDQVPATPVFYKYFPPFRRFTYSIFLISCAKCLVYGISPLWAALVTRIYGYSGILLMLIPAGICFLASVAYFEKREKESLELKI
jgi:MHS family proline/betaine transporter-like MFS transporter